MKFRHAITLLALAVATSAFAADSPMKQIDFFAGTWQCKGVQTMGGPAIHYTGTATGTWVLDKKWLDIRVSQVKTKENPTPFSGRSYMGYDQESKKYVQYWVDNMGGFESAMFNGWSGDKLMWETTAHMGSMSANSRDIFTKNGNNKMTHTFELEQSGKWTEVMKETCERK